VCPLAQQAVGMSDMQLLQPIGLCCLYVGHGHFCLIFMAGREAELTFIHNC